MLTIPDHILHSHILIVDDTLENLQLLASMLESEGYKIRKTTSGRLALQFAQIKTPDLILLDINMPEMNGYQVCKELKSSEKTRDIPVVFISALDRVGHKVQAFEVGGCDYITKPFQEQEVLIRVKNQLLLQSQKRQLRKQNQRLEKEIQQRELAEAKITKLNLHLKEQVKARTLALQQSLKLETNLSEAQEIAHIGNWEFDVVTGKITWSAEMFRILGRDPVLGEPNYEENLQLYHPDDAELLHLMIERALSTFEPYSLLLRAVRKDSSIRYIEARGRTSFNNRGKLIRLMGTIQDITERKLSEFILKASEEKYRSLVENMVDGLYLVNWDFQLFYLNPAIEKIFGRTREYLFAEKPKIFLDFVHPDDYELVRASFFSGNSISDLITINYRIVRPDGEIRYVRDALYVIRDESGNVQHYQGIVSDITEIKQAIERERLVASISQDIRQSLNLEQILKTTVTEVRQFFQVDRALIYRADPESCGSIVSESDGPNITTLQEQELPEDIFPREHHSLYQKGRIRAVVDIDQDTIAECLVDTLRKFGVKSKLVVPILTTVKIYPDGQDIGKPQSQDELWGLLVLHQCHRSRQWQPTEIELVKQLADQVAIAIQQSELYQKLEQANQELRKLAVTDALTRIVNRRGFDEHLKEEWRRLAGEQKPLSLILCDIDHFKQYNDTYGHPAGDECLFRVAGAMRCKITRPRDLVARYGGEEFVIILPNTKETAATQIVEGIREEIKGLSLPHEKSLVSDYITLSFGIATIIPTPSTSPQFLIDKADKALYQAKAKGRNCYCISV
jgi:diguanylate cyclase (GGDEF)-like protein/PAS domain S-box-containing protein